MLVAAMLLAGRRIWGEPRAGSPPPCTRSTSRSGTTPAARTPPPVRRALGRRAAAPRPRGGHDSHAAARWRVRDGLGRRPPWLFEHGRPFGLFGLVLIALLGSDARGLATRQRATGPVRWSSAGSSPGAALFPFRARPAGGARGVEAGPDLFPGRTVSSSTTSRSRACGYGRAGSGRWRWVSRRAGGLLARAAAARPMLAAWLLAWALLMVLKEPLLLPKMLRWAKEDQFVSPLLCLLIAAALSAIPDRTLRRAAAVATIAIAAWLQVRDFGYHASTPPPVTSSRGRALALNAGLAARIDRRRAGRPRGRGAAWPSARAAEARSGTRPPSTWSTIPAAAGAIAPGPAPPTAAASTRRRSPSTRGPARCGPGLRGRARDLARARPRRLVRGGIHRPRGPDGDAGAGEAPAGAARPRSSTPATPPTAPTRSTSSTVTRASSTRPRWCSSSSITTTSSPTRSRTTSGLRSRSWKRREGRCGSPTSRCPAGAARSAPRRGRARPRTLRGSVALEWLRDRLARGAPRAYNALAALRLWEPLGGDRGEGRPAPRVQAAPAARDRGGLDADRGDPPGAGPRGGGHGSRFAVVYVPSRMEVSDRDWELTKLSYGLDESVWERGLVARRVQDIGRGGLPGARPHPGPAPGHGPPRRRAVSALRRALERARTSRRRRRRRLLPARGRLGPGLRPRALALDNPPEDRRHRRGRFHRLEPGRAAARARRRGRRPRRPLPRLASRTSRPLRASRASASNAGTILDPRATWPRSRAGRT